MIVSFIPVVVQVFPLFADLNNPAPVPAKITFPLTAMLTILLFSKPIVSIIQLFPLFAFEKIPLFVPTKTIESLKTRDVIKEKVQELIEKVSRGEIKG